MRKEKQQHNKREHHDHAVVCTAVGRRPFASDLRCRSVRDRVTLDSRLCQLLIMSASVWLSKSAPTTANYDAVGG